MAAACLAEVVSSAAGEWRDPGRHQLGEQPSHLVRVRVRVKGER